MSASGAFVKVSVNLPSETVDALKSLAAKRGCSMTRVLAHGIGAVRFFQGVSDNGGKILQEHADGRLVEVVFL